MPLLTPSTGIHNDARNHLNRIGQKVPVISTFNIAGLERILNLAELHNFNVYLTNSPLYAGIWYNSKFRSYFDKLQNKLERFSAVHSRLFFLRFDSDLTFPAEKMENVDHVIYSAAQIYTSRIAERIRASGWQGDFDTTTK